MKLVRSVPRLGGLPDLHFVACPSCNETEVKDVTGAEVKDVTRAA